MPLNDSVYQLTMDNSPELSGKMFITLNFLPSLGSAFQDYYVLIQKISWVLRFFFLWSNKDNTNKRDLNSWQKINIF